MSGTKVGGLKASVTNKEKHGDDFSRSLHRDPPFIIPSVFYRLSL